MNCPSLRQEFGLADSFGHFQMDSGRKFSFFAFSFQNLLSELEQDAPSVQSLPPWGAGQPLLIFRWHVPS